MSNARVIMTVLGVTVCLVAVIMIIAFAIVTHHDPKNTDAPVAARTDALHAFNWCGHQKAISLTFDDGPNVETTPSVLADLARLNIKATFFLSPAVHGDPTTAQCAMVQDILNGGHSVQSHSYDHSDTLGMTHDQISANLKRNSEWIASCSGDRHVQPTMFRPPYGNLDPTTATFISKEFSYDIATWSIDTHDTVPHTGPDAILKNVDEQMRAVSEGGSAVILMHDHMYKSGGSIGALDLLSAYFQAKEYAFVDMTECRRACHDQDVCKATYESWPGVFDQAYT